MDPRGRAERSQCVEKAKHIGDRRLLAHRRPSLYDASRRGRILQTSSSASPWCWPRPRHRGQRIPTVPSRIGPVEVDFVLVRHFSGRIFFRPSSMSLASRATRDFANITILRGVVFFSDRFYNRKGAPFWLAQRPKRDRHEVNTLLTPRPD